MMKRLTPEGLKAGILRNKRILHLIAMGLVIFTLPLGIVWYLDPSGHYEPPIVALVSLAAVVGGSPSLAEMFGRKPVRDLSYEEIIELIIKSDQARDWEGIQRPDREVMFYKYDPNLRFEFLHTDEGVQCRDFREPWANKFLHRSATGYYHELYYGSTPLGRFILVAVDGAQVSLPLPRNNHNLTVSKINYAVAKIHDVLGTLDQYMSMAGMRVE